MSHPRGSFAVVLGRAAAVAFGVGSLVAFAAAPPAQLTRTDIGAGLEPNGIAIADFDGDGDLDLATIDRTLQIVKIRRNTGDGITYMNENVALLGAPDDLAFGNFDGDAFPDLVVVGGGKFEVVLNTGPGSDSRLRLALQAPVGQPVGFSYTSVATIDLDKNGRDDIAVAFDNPNISNGGMIDLYLASGAGAFTISSGKNAGQDVSDLASGDLNGDGYDDLVATSPSDRGLYYFSNRGLSGFPYLNNAEFDLGTNVPLRIAIGAVTADGKPDVVAGGYQTRGDFSVQTVEIFRNLGGATHESGQPSGRFWHEYGLTIVSPISPIPVSPLPPGLAVADMNGDGRLDVVLCSPETDTLLIQHFTTVTGGGGAFVSLELDGRFDYAAPDAGACVVTGRMDAGTSVDAVVLGRAGTMAVFRGPTGGGGGGGGGGGDPVDPPPGAPLAATDFAVKVPRTVADGQKWKFSARQTDEAVTGVRVQSSATPSIESSWRDLPSGAAMKGNSKGVWKTISTDVTALDGTNTLSFRTVSSAPGRLETASGPSASYVVAPGAPKLEVEMTAVSSSDPTGRFVSPGEGFIYTLTVRNVGSARLDGVVLEAAIADGLTFLTATEPFVPVDSRGVLRWDLGTLLPGATVERGYVATLPESSRAEVVLTAPAQVQVNGKRVRSKLLIAAVRGILSLQIEPRSESVGAGEVLGYTLTVRNNSFDTVSDVVVTDVVPARTRRSSAFFLDADGVVTGSPIANPFGGLNPQFDPAAKVGKTTVPQVTWYLGAIAPKSERKLLLEVRTPYDLPGSGEIVNGGYNALGRLPSGGKVSAFRPSGPDVAVPIAARADATAPVIELLQYANTDRGGLVGRSGASVVTALHGETITYSVAYRNAGTASAAGTVVRGTFPPGTDFVPGSFFIDGVASAQDSRVTIGTAGWSVDLGSFAPGPYGALFFVVRVRNDGAKGAPKAGSSVVASVSMTSTDYAEPIHAEPEALAVVIPPSVAFVVNTDRALRSRAALGETHRYIHTVHNVGGRGVTDVVATGEIPLMTCTAATVRGAPAAFTQNGNRVAIAVGNLAANEEVTVTLDCRLDTAPAANGQVIHVMRFAGVAATGKAAVPATGVGSDAMDFDGAGRATLCVGSIAPYYATTGSEFTYTVFWGNTTDATARNVVVRAQVSPGLRVVTGGIGDGGVLTNGVLTWRVGDVPGHWGGAVTFRVVADNDVSSGGSCFVTERAWITGANAPNKGSGLLATNVRDGFFATSFLQSGACILGGFGLAVQGGGRFALDTALAGLDGSSQSVRVGGADTFPTANGVITIPLRGGRVLAMGPSTSISTADPGALQRTTTGNNVFILADADQIEVQGIVCTGTVSLAEVLERRLEVVNCDEANVFSLGGGNLVDPQGLGLLSNDAAGQLILSGRLEGAGIVKNAGGSSVSLLGGSVLPAAGAGLIGLDGGSLIGQDGGTLIGLDGSTLVAAGAGNLVGLDGGSLVGNDGASLVGNDGGTLVGNDGASLVGNDGASLAGTNR